MHYKFKYGKHAGQTLSHVWKTDPLYVIDLASNIKDKHRGGYYHKALLHYINGDHIRKEQERRDNMRHEAVRRELDRQMLMAMERDG